MTSGFVLRCCQSHKSTSAEHRLSEAAVLWIADKIKTPLSLWPGNCHRIAARLLQYQVFDGRLQYGLYKGPIHGHSIFSGPAVRHGWIRSDDTIIDPTRWVFEFVTPYIYLGPVESDDYDFAMSELRKEMRVPFDSLDLSKGRQTKYKIPASLLDLVGRLTTISQQGTDSLQPVQLCWLAGADLAEFGDEATPLYTWLDRLGMRAFIPVDHWNEVMVESGNSEA